MTPPAVVIANWKMHKTVPEATAFVAELRSCLAPKIKTQVVLAPSFTALASVALAVRGTLWSVGAQDLHWEPEGAFTGEVSGKQLSEIGCRYVLVGHSERRRWFGETDETVNRKLKAVIRHGMIPVACIGETREEREKGHALSVLDRQLVEGLAGLTPEKAAALMVAYEPVWAIGTGLTAQPAQIEEAHTAVRRGLVALFGREAGAGIPILYGGSVNPDVMPQLLTVKELQGALVGGASLQAATFSKIVLSLEKR
jgi:triosephosphate isomerase